MAKDFSSDQGGIQSSDSTQFSEHQDPNEPVTGFVQSGPSELAAKGPGPGISKNTRVIR
jgi:hypothetical protein